MPLTSHPLFAIVIRVLATLFVATLMMLVKYSVSLGISMPELLFWRQAVTLPAMLIALALMGELGRLRTRRLKSHALRATVSTVGMTSIFFASALLSLPQASVLTFTSPFFAVLTAALIMKDRVGPWRWFAVLLGFAGVLIVANPTVSDINPLGALAGLTAAFVVVIVSYQVKDLARTDDPIACVFYLALFATLYVGVLLPFYARAHTPFEWALMMAIGLSGMIGQFLMTLSLKYGAVSTVLIMDYTLLLWSTIYSWLVWNNFPQTATWIGAPFIIVAGIIITLREHQLAKAASPLSANQLD